MPHIERIRDWESLTALAEPWNRLAGPCPFRRFEWLATWWKHFGESDASRAKRELYALLVRDERGEIIAIAPWFSERQTGRGRVVRFLGSGDVCTDYLSLLVAPEHQQTAVAALAEWLHKSGTHPERFDDRFDWMEWQEVVDGDDALEELADLLAVRGFRMSQRRRMNSWRLSLPGDWSEYLARLSKSTRRQTRRVEESLGDSGSWRLRIVNSVEELPAAMATLIDLHQRRRQSLGQPGCFADAAFTAFLTEAAERLAAAGLLEIHLLEYEGRPVAAEFDVLGDDGVMHVYQSGLEPECLDLQLGRAMHVASIQRAIALGRGGFDMLRGDEPYKPHLRAEPIPLVSWQIVPPRMLPELRYNMLAAGGQMRDWIKGTLAAAGMAGK